MRVTAKRVKLSDSPNGVRGHCYPMTQDAIRRSTRVHHLRHHVHHSTRITIVFLFLLSPTKAQSGVRLAWCPWYVIDVKRQWSMPPNPSAFILLSPLPLPLFSPVPQTRYFLGPGRTMSVMTMRVNSNAMILRILPSLSTKLETETFSWS